MFGKAALSQFIELEADHEVAALCERPLKIPDSKPTRVIDFWALRVIARKIRPFLVILLV